MVNQYKRKIEMSIYEYDPTLKQKMSPHPTRFVSNFRCQLSFTFCGFRGSLLRDIKTFMSYLISKCRVSDTLEPDQCWRDSGSKESTSFLFVFIFVYIVK